MRALFYAIFLLAVLVGSIVLLRSIEPPRETPLPRPTPIVHSGAPAPSEAGIGDATPEELHAIGAELLGLWHVREAAETFEQAAASDSTLRQTWLALVECYSHPLVAREDAARAAIAHAAHGAFAPGESLFVAGVGNLFVDRDYGAAVGDFTAARRHEVDHPDAAYYLALAYFLSGRLADVDRALEELLSEDDTVGRVIELAARSAAAAGDLETASARARDLARLYAGEPFPYVLLAQVELLRGDPDAAHQFCNNALLLDARYLSALLAQAGLYAAAGRYEAAHVSFEKLLLFDDPVLRAIGYDGIAWVDFLTGEFDAGIDAMDEAIRNAMLAGSVRAGLSYATRLVGYLCELGQADAAEAVVERWVRGFGDVPERLGRLRIDILDGDVAVARRVLLQVQTRKEWLVWARVMSIDTTELVALTQIAAREHDKAAATLSEERGTAGVAAGVRARRAFLSGYALFESGAAETAEDAFAAAREHLFGLEFPYRADPVLFQQAQFFLAESKLARGDEAGATADYDAFLAAWGETEWEIPAVDRARDKRQSLSGAPETR
ncbi:MAG: hypothetical protein OEO21_04940 [Candidatus Krumholzibacteria bacterium]|nr:hypothetical protein [Candidatus Krumholzibacteria bacterium]